MTDIAPCKSEGPVLLSLAKEAFWPLENGLWTWRPGKKYRSTVFQRVVDVCVGGSPNWLNMFPIRACPSVGRLGGTAEKGNKGEPHTWRRSISIQFVTTTITIRTLPLWSKCNWQMIEVADISQTLEVHLMVQTGKMVCFSLTFRMSLDQVVKSWSHIRVNPVNPSDGCLGK